MTRDAAEVLAEALRETFPAPESYEAWQERVDASYEGDASLLLAALDAAGYVITPKAARPDHRAFSEDMATRGDYYMEHPEQQAARPVSGLEARDWQRLEADFWRAEGEWAKAGSGMTKDQQTGASLAFSWLRSPQGGRLQRAPSEKPATRPGLEAKGTVPPTIAEAYQMGWDDATKAAEAIADVYAAPSDDALRAALEPFAALDDSGLDRSLASGMATAGGLITWEMLDEARRILGETE